MGWGWGWGGWVGWLAAVMQGWAEGGGYFWGLSLRGDGAVTYADRKLVWRRDICPEQKGASPHRDHMSTPPEWAHLGHGNTLLVIK